MLIELRCEKFQKKCITFHKGLNVVLGTEDGENSIGKTTFLMVLDYIFGGDDYITIEKDVQEHIKCHEFCFRFRFGNEDFWFRRNNVDTTVVAVCDDKYNIVKTISIDEYKNFLAEKYGLNLPLLSFRDSVGRYSRIYNKENVDEHWPLHVAKGESAQKAVIALLKLLDCYSVIHTYREAYDIAKEKADAFYSAQKFDLIPILPTKKQYKENGLEIKQLEDEIRGIESKLSIQFTDASSTLTVEAAEIRKELTIAKSQRSKIYSKIFKLKANLDYCAVPLEKDFSKLTKYFPNAELKEIVELEQFHKCVVEILKSNMREEKKKLEKELADINKIIDELDSQLLELVSTTNIPIAVLKKYSTVQKRLDFLIRQNEYFEKKVLIENDKQTAKNNLDVIAKDILTKVECQINEKMATLNDKIYNGQKTAPTIKFNAFNYQFYTPDDTGTGTSYKGMIVFDLAILEMSRLPFLIHDSILLKQIADSALTEIVKIYASDEKQVFIAIDKQGTYGEVCLKLLEDNKVLSLGPDRQALFGESWNKKKIATDTQ